MGIGYSGTYNSVPCPDAFVQYEISEANEHMVSVNGTILTFLNDDKSNSTVTYSFMPLYDYQDYYYLDYNYFDNTTVFTSGRGTRNFRRFIVMDSVYVCNKEIKNYTDEVAGVKNLSGMVFDTFLLREPKHDSIYALTTDFTFTEVNDSTISFDKKIFYIDDMQLHYKYTDYSNNTVVYETLHDYYYYIARITYNYTSRKLVFEQWLKDAGMKKYLKLEQ